MRNNSCVIINKPLIQRSISLPLSALASKTSQEEPSKSYSFHNAHHQMRLNLSNYRHRTPKHRPKASHHLSISFLKRKLESTNGKERSHSPSPETLVKVLEVDEACEDTCLTTHSTLKSRDLDGDSTCFACERTYDSGVGGLGGDLPRDNKGIILRCALDMKDIGTRCAESVNGNGKTCSVDAESGIGEEAKDEECSSI